jgi:hypothetical protein
MSSESSKTRINLKTTPFLSALGSLNVSQGSFGLDIKGVEPVVTI